VSDLAGTGRDGRYSRQCRFAEFGCNGQKALSAMRVAVLGCGALGAASSEMLVRAGVASLRLIDRDFVEASNLQRQSLYSEADAEAAVPKVHAAKNRLSQVNSEVEIKLSVAEYYSEKGSYTVVVKVIDIFGNDTTKLLDIVV
jgi:molybdopterin/thiamine biosynthesis adenylyltransferase